MLDPENYIFTVLAETLRGTFSGIAVYGEEVPAPPIFPCVTCVESDNTIEADTLTGDGKEHFIRVMFSVNVYSNLQTGGKQQCKDIMSVVDQTMMGIGLRRTMNQPLDNLQHTISRRVARYEGRVGEDGLVYRR